MSTCKVEEITSDDEIEQKENEFKQKENEQHHYQQNCNTNDDTEQDGSFSVWENSAVSKENVKTVLDNATFSIDGKHIVYTLYNLLKGAQNTVYISASLIDWNLPLNEEPTITLAEMIVFLCNVNNVTVFILMGERILIEQVVPEELLSLRNCVIKIIPQFGPIVKDEAISWVPSVEQWIEKTTSVGIFEFNNVSISKLSHKGVFEYNQSYVMVDNKYLLLGAFELNDTLSGYIEHIDEEMIKEQLVNHEDVDLDKDLNLDKDLDVNKPKYFGENSDISFSETSEVNKDGVINKDTVLNNNRIINKNKEETKAGKQNSAGQSTSYFGSLTNAFTGLGSFLCCNSLLNLDNSHAAPRISTDDPSENDLTQSESNRNESNNNESNLNYSLAGDSNIVKKLAFHRVCTVIYPTPDLIHFVQNNWDQNGKAVPMISPFSDLQLIGSFKENQSELALLTKWITEAKELIYIETSHINSSAKTSNKLIEAIVDRLIVAHEKCLIKKGEFAIDPMRVIILTNANYFQGSLLDRFSSFHVDHTADYILKLISMRGYKPIEFRNRLFVGYLSNQYQYIYIKSTVVIQDNCRALLTSANLNDRSLMKQNQELGIAIHHQERVSDLRQFLWRDHLQYTFQKLDEQNEPNYNEQGYNENGKIKDSTKEITVQQFFSACHHMNGNLRRFKLQRDKKTNL